MIKICEYCCREFDGIKARLCSAECRTKSKSLKMHEWNHRPDIYKSNSERQSNYMLIKENREKMSAFQKVRQNEETVRNAKSEFMQILKNTDEDRIRNSKCTGKLWENPDYADKVFKKSTKYKTFTFPSGRTACVQGYEPQVIIKLLSEYDEVDIVVGVKNIHNCIGLIKYTFNNIQHNYYPDIYIKSTNTIIEVKSKWTFELHKEKNLAKEYACLQQGFNFIFDII